MATLFNTKIKDTYQSLLKLEDNTILTTTSKNITDGLGNASPLYLSTTQVRIGSNSASAMYWDNTNSRLGIGTSSPTNPVSIGGVGTNGSVSFNRSSDAATQGYIGTLGTGITLNGGTSFIYMGTTNTNAIGTSPLTTLGAMWGIRGSGSTSATTSLLVQNSSAVDLLKLQDNGVLTLGTFASGLGKLVVTCDPAYGTKSVIENNFGGQIIRQVSSDVLYFGGQQVVSLIGIGYLSLNAPYIFGNNHAGNTTASSFTFRVTGSPYGQTPSTASRGVLFDGQLGFQSGGYANYFELSPTYSFDISNNRIVRGIYYNPTLVTPNTNDKHYGIQTTSGGAYINTTTPQASAALQVDSTTQGFLPPRVTTIQKNAISSPAEGLFVYDSDLKRPCFFNGATWVTL